MKGGGKVLFPGGKGTNKRGQGRAVWRRTQTRNKDKYISKCHIETNYFVA